LKNITKRHRGGKAKPVVITNPVLAGVLTFNKMGEKKKGENEALGRPRKKGETLKIRMKTDERRVSLWGNETKNRHRKKKLRNRGRKEVKNSTGHPSERNSVMQQVDIQRKND